MPRPITMMVYLLTGVALGMVFFGGLWLTVRALPAARYPTALAIASYWGRIVLVVGAFALVFSRGWQVVLSCLLGFLLARLLLARKIPHAIVTRRTAE